jgi:molybdenum cofactor biosynthesis enzyme
MVGMLEDGVQMEALITITVAAVAVVRMVLDKMEQEAVVAEVEMLIKTLHMELVQYQ